MIGEPLRIELLDGPDFETDSVEQERRGGVGVGDLDYDNQRIAETGHVLIRLDFESGNSLTELRLSNGGFWFKREREIEKERDWQRKLDSAISSLRLGLGRVYESFFLSQAVFVSPSFSLSFRK